MNRDESRGKYPVLYGAKIKVEDGSRVKGPRDQKRGDLIAEWDPFSIPILAEVDGIVKFGDIIEGATMQEQVDEFTGLSRKVIIESKDTDMRPRISIKDKKGRTVKVPGTSTVPGISFRSGRTSSFPKGTRSNAGDIIVKIPRETTKTKDITGGLPRVAELFEARKPKEYAVISEIDGVV